MSPAGGSKHHLLVDGGGLPLAWTLTAANRNDVTQLLDLLDRVPPVRAAPADRANGRTRCSPTAATTITKTAGSSANAGSDR
jgi:hypothetical protein